MTETVPGSSHAPAKHSTGVLILLFFGVLMGALDISIVGPAMPSISSTLNIPTDNLSWIFNIYILFNLVGISLFARLSDIYGRRLMYVLAVAIFGAGSVIVSFAPDLTWLLIGRGVQGFGSSGIFPVALAVIGDIFPAEKRGRALGLIGAVFGIAFLAGPFIAGTMLLYFSWNALFLVNIPAALLIIILALKFLPAKPVLSESNIDWPGIILLGASLGLFTIALTNLDTARVVDSLMSVQVLPLLIFSVILVSILLMIERAMKRPVIEVRFFQSREIRLVGILGVCLGIISSTILFLPSFAVASFGVTASEASFMLIPLVLLTAVGSPLNGRLVDIIGSRIIIITGLIFITVGLVVFGYYSGTRNIFYIAAAMLGFGLSIRAALNYIMLNEVEDQDRASSQGLLIIFISIGQLAGAALIGIFIASSPAKSEGYHNAFIVLAVISAIMLLMSLFLKSRSKERASFKN